MMADQAPADGAVTLTPEQLDELIRRAVQQAGASGGLLPPGAYRDADGRVYRDVYVPAPGRVNPETGREEQGLRRTRRRVMLVPDPSPEGLLRAQDAAYRANPPHDVYHPDYGWLRNGRKREVEVPQNAGGDVDNDDVEYVPIGDDPRQGIPLPAAPEPEPAPAKAGTRKGD